jgi:hypothetical protein
MDSFQKRDRDRKQRLKQLEKAERRKERSRSSARRGDGTQANLHGVGPVSVEESSAVRVDAPGTPSPGGTP